MAIKQRLDSPTNNHCVWNNLAGRYKNSTSPFLQPTFSEGNTKVTAHSSEVTHAIGTIASSQKHYAEFIVSGGTSVITGVGVVSSEWDKSNLQSYIYNFGGAIYAADGTLYSDTTTDTSPIAITTSFRVGIEVDFGANEVAFFKVESNGTRTQQGSTITTNIDFKGSGTFAASLHNNNDYIEAYFIEDDWWGTPNSGYTALCTANLPEMTPTVNDDVPKNYFKAVKYVGDYSSPATISVGFNPDLVWIKQRTPYPSQSHCIYDSVRGVSKRLYSDSTSQEITPDGNGGVTNFSDNNGFELTRPTNAAFEGFDSSMQMIAWCWKAGGAPSADDKAMVDGVVRTITGDAKLDAGSITPTRMSVNTDAGFSIIRYTGNGNSVTVPHGLSAATEFIILKNISSTSDGGNGYHWTVYHKDLTYTHYGSLDSIDQFYNDSSVWHAAPTSSVFSFGANPRGSELSQQHIAYCWHSVEGCSKFGSYTGNGSTDGTFVYCGFRPAFVMIKRTDVAGSWEIQDSERAESNPVNKYLYADVTDAEATFPNTDFLSNGFKLRNTGVGNNVSGATYIFMAFAEQPFNYANAR